MSSDDLIHSGNTFAYGFLLVFGFLYFVVIIPHFEEEQERRELRRRAGEAQGQIMALERYINTRLLKTGGPPAFVSPRSPSSRAVKGPGPRMDRRKADEEQARLREQLVQMHSKFIELEKSKPKKEFTIPVPGFPLALPEDLIVSLFPLFALYGFVRLLVYRAALLNRPAAACSTVPVWAAPVPYGRFRQSFLRWTVVNFLGFVAVGLLFFVIVDFLAHYSGERVTQRYAYLTFSTATEMAAVLYAATLFYAIFLAKEETT